MAKEKVKRSADNALSASLAAQHLETKTQISKYHTKGGHGFAAEDANNLNDRLRGKKSEVVGILNELNGADRVVDGVRVQSKYCQNASKTIAGAFGSGSGNYRYEGQVLEVPKDQYEACVELMRKRIVQGKVPGFKNPADAELIVREGTVTYKQARNIARAGNVDSLVFDAKTQAVTSTHAFAISFAVTFAQNCWYGENAKNAMKAALESAILAGSTTLVTGIISAQFLRTQAAAKRVVFVRSGMKALSSTNIGRQAIHRIAAGSLGKAVYGASAINHVSKLLRSNVVTATIATAVTSAPDAYRAAISRSISWRQFTKNFTVNVAGIATGIVGWIAAGAAIGSAFPGVGTGVGLVVGTVGALVGGGIGAKGAKAIADKIADDDSKHLLMILQDEIQSLAFEYMLTEDEVEDIASKVKSTVKPKWLRRMFKETNGATNKYRSRKFIRTEFEPYFEAIIKKRPKIALPPSDQIEEEVLSYVRHLARYELIEVLRLVKQSTLYELISVIQKINLKQKY